MSAQDVPTLAKVAELLGTPEQAVMQLLEEGRLDGALVSAIRRSGGVVTPNVKDSVQMLVRSMESQHFPSGSNQPEASYPTSEATATIMFTDMVESTAMMERLGDRLGRHVMSRHDQIMRRQAAEHHGVEVKSTGDGFMLTFPSVRRGLLCAIAMQEALVKSNKEHSESPILVRIGLSVGEPIRDDEDLFGMSVIIASRIATMANSGQVLISQIAYSLVSNGGDFRFRPLDPVELKGIDGAHHLYELLWRN